MIILKRTKKDFWGKC